MKTTDLQIGDLVDYRGKVIEVTSLYAKNGSNEIGFTDKEETWVDGSVIDPIPLTLDILEKNGFECNDSIGELWTDDYHIKCEPFWVHIFNLRFNDYKIEMPLDCVHQLQHALRLCGIDKEIIL